MTLALDWTLNGRCREVMVLSFPVSGALSMVLASAVVLSGGGGVRGVGRSDCRVTLPFQGPSWESLDKSSYYEIQVGRCQRRRLLVVNCSRKLVERLEDMLQRI